MAIQKTDKIWHNGKLINWDDAHIHVMSHVVHYGSSVFEGIRCYELPTGPAIFRATEHMQRLLDSAKVYRMDLPFSLEEIIKGMLDTVSHNGAWPCYIRPVVFRGYGDAGVNPLNCPVEMYIVNYPWGKYLSGDGDGVDVCVSSWTRLAPNTLPAMAKAGAELHELAADQDGSHCERLRRRHRARQGRIRQRGLGREPVPGASRQADHRAARATRCCPGSRATRCCRSRAT